MYWWIWLIAGLGLAAAEVFLGTFVLLMFAIGAIAAAGVAALGGGPVLESIVFVAVSVLALLAARPAITRHLKASTGEGAQPFGVAAIEGETCTVLERVDLEQGRVKIGGETWRARSYDGTQVFEPGERVRVIEIKGATALVWRE